MFRYHVVGCRQLRSQDLLEEEYVTTLSGHPLRFSEREVSPSRVSDLDGPQTQDSAAKPSPLHPCALPAWFKTLSLLGHCGLQ